jgi:lysophospholipase L1-like esterase
MKRYLLVALFVLGWIGVACGQEPFYLKDGDRVVFYGDSITDQRLYTTFTETFVVTRFPKLKVTFVHSGWGGDRVKGGSGGPVDVRLRRDVFAYKPTVMTIMLGMNDGSYRAFDQGIFDTYANGCRHIVQSVKSAFPKIRITAIEPSPYDDVTRPPQFEGGYNAVLVRYGQFIAELAKSEGLNVADLNTPVVAALKTAQDTDPKLAGEIIRDRVHPGPGGHLLMAEALLKSWNAPAVVTAVVIDAAARRVEKSEGTEVSMLDARAGGIAWTQKDAALPMPFDSRNGIVQLSVRSSDFLTALNQEPLTVTGLKASQYVLKIDGERVGVFTGAQLAAGVNLAALPTPMAAQAMRVHELTLDHNNVHFARWRQVQVPLQDFYLSSAQGALAALDNLESELVARQRAVAKPMPRRYELTPEQ